MDRSDPLAEFERIVVGNRVIEALLPRLAELDLPDWYLTQTMSMTSLYASGGERSW